MPSSGSCRRTDWSPPSGRQRINENHGYTWLTMSSGQLRTRTVNCTNGRRSLCRRPEITSWSNVFVSHGMSPSVRRPTAEGSVRQSPLIDSYDSTASNHPELRLEGFVHRVFRHCVFYRIEQVNPSSNHSCSCTDKGNYPTVSAFLYLRDSWSKFYISIVLFAPFRRS